MSGFVCLLDRSGGTVDPRELERLVEPLSIYGPAAATLCRGPVGIAVRYRPGDGACPGPEPVLDPHTGTAAAIVGRLGLLAEPPGRPQDGSAALAAAREVERRPSVLAGSVGSFAVVVANPARGRVSIARDHLGSHKVYYRLDGHRLIAASEPTAILRHPAVGDGLDEVAAARFLGFRFGDDERSFFRDVRELPPAHALRVGTGEERIEPYWRFREPGRDGERSPRSATSEFLDLLARSVAHDAAGLEPEQVALSLSGGLDSTAVAAVAPPGVRAFSWTFEETPEADERRRVEAVSRHLGVPVHWVRGDGLHPLCAGFARRFVHAGSPYVNPFAALKCRLYEEARAAGCERVLVGDGGDALYAAREYWLRDAMTGGGPRALADLAGTLRRAAGGDRFARVALRRLLPLGVRRRPLRRETPWLTSEARAALRGLAPSPTLPQGAGDGRHELVAGSRHVEIVSEERRLFAACGVERADPFWSWPLLEMAVQLPATWFQRGRRTKVLTREAFRGRLPESVLEGEPGGSLASLFLRGIALRREDLRERVFRRPRSDWQRWVRPEWLEPYLEATRTAAFGHTILWRVISYELWQRLLIRGS